MANLSATPLIWLSATNKTEYFFGLLGLFLHTCKALCTFEMLVVTLSHDSQILPRTAKLLDSVIRLFDCCVFLCLLLSEWLLFTGIQLLIPAVLCSTLLKSASSYLHWYLFELALVDALAKLISLTSMSVICWADLSSSQVFWSSHFNSLQLSQKSLCLGW